MNALPPAGRRLAATLVPVYAAAALRLLVPLLLLPTMAGRLGPEAFGRLGFVLVWAGLLSLVVEGGFLASATRLAVRADRAERWRLATQVATARTLLCLAVLPLAAAAALWAAPGAFGPDAGHLPHSPWPDAVAIAALACALGWPANWYLQATQQLGRWARVEFAVYAALLIGCALLAHDVWSYVALQALAAGALAWRGWAWLRRDLAPPTSTSTSTSPATPATKPPMPTLWSPAALAPGCRLAWTMLPVSIAGAAYSYALPAVASGRMPAAELGLYFLADRILRALLAAAEPVFSVVYPRIVGSFAAGAGAALRHAARWAAGGLAAGVLALAALAALRPAWEPLLQARGGLEPARVGDVLGVLGWLLPLLFGWKFIGYWMLGSGRCDRAYRACLYAGGAVGIAGAACWPGARSAVGLAELALVAEAVVIAVAVAGAWVTFRGTA